MKNKKTKAYIISIIIIILSLLLSFTINAHSGRTDSSGGHRDNKNKSGLGSYHYHCGGYPAHLHSNGYCPYKSSPSKTKTSKIYVSNMPITIECGSSKEFSYSISDDDSVVWYSSDSSIISVSNGGTLTAHKPGSVTITAKMERGSKTFKVTSTAVPAKSLTIESKKNRIEIGKSLILVPNIIPKNTTYKNIVWSSSDSLIAKVDSDGTVIGKKEGNVTITATLEEDKISASFDIEVYIINPKSITLDKTELELEIDKTAQLKATIEPHNATFKDIIWSSSNEKIITVTQAGYIEPKSLGTAQIIVSTKNGKKATATVKVFRIFEKSVEINIETQPAFKLFGKEYYDIDEKIKISTEVLPKNATYKEVSVDIENGMFFSKDEIKAIETGEMQIIAKSKSGITTISTIRIIDYDFIIEAFQKSIIILFLIVMSSVIILKYKKIKKKEQ